MSRLTRFISHSCASFASRVYPKPSCDPPSSALIQAVSHSSSRPNRSCHGPPMESRTLRRHQVQVATYTVAFTPQLCCALRFSQPLDAFFHLHPFGLVSCRYHPGFRLQSLPTALASPAFRRALPLLLFNAGLSRHHHLSSRDCCNRGVRTYPPRCYSLAGGRSSPDVHPFEVFLSQSRPPYGRLLSWASVRYRPPTEAIARHRTCSAEFQRTEESLISFEIRSLPGIFSPASSVT